MRIVVIDDHPVVREGLVAGLPDEELEVVGSAASIDEGLQLVQRTRPDVVLLDLEFPEGSGLDAIPRILQSSSGTAVVVLTAYEVDEQILGAIQAGARGYLLKGASLRDIRAAVRAAHRGESVLDPRVAPRLMNSLRGDSPRLSPREREVLRLLHQGNSNKEIGATLGVTERTAKFHVTSILNKLGAENRTQAVAMAVKQGLV